MGDARRAELRRLKAELAAARRFGGGSGSAKPFADRRQLLGYISGFVCAEGCCGMSGNRPRFSVHLRQDDEPLLRLLAAETGLGKVSTHRPAPPLNPSVTWTVAGRALEHRAARRDAQQERVISAVLRFEREHGRLPRALEFFRWRLESAVDAPAQGPVYRLFPGGWADVLERARQVAGATV